jgi:hypothetical protein
VEKVIYRIEHEGGAPAGLGERLRGEVSARLLDLGAHGVQVNVVDDDVAPAAGLRMISSAVAPDAYVSVWLDSATDHLRTRVDEAISLVGGVAHAYLVTESVPLRSGGPEEPGGRTPGMAQVVCFRRAPGLSDEDFLATWLGSHTQIAIDTQDTTSYVQNVVQRVLTPGSAPWDAIVEECFPAAAMTDPGAFFDAVGDPERLAEHGRIMFESVQRFIDLSAIDVVPTSRYDVATW